MSPAAKEITAPAANSVAKITSVMVIQSVIA
jgi:hypothetical protein